MTSRLLRFFRGRGRKDKGASRAPQEQQHQAPPPVVVEVRQEVKKGDRYSKEVELTIWSIRVGPLQMLVRLPWASNSCMAWHSFLLLFIYNHDQQQQPQPPSFLELPDQLQCHLTVMYLHLSDICSLRMTCARLSRLDILPALMENYSLSSAVLGTPITLTQLWRMLMARLMVGEDELAITWGSTSWYWGRDVSVDGWYRRVAKLEDVWWFEISGYTQPIPSPGRYHVFLCACKIHSHSFGGDLYRTAVVEGGDDEVSSLPRFNTYHDLPVGQWAWIRLGTTDVSQPGVKIRFRAWDHDSTRKEGFYFSHVEVIPEALLMDPRDKDVDMCLASPLTGKSDGR